MSMSGPRIFRALCATMSAALVMSCGGSNYLTPMSVKTSDDAIYEDILKLVDSQSWDAALTRLSELSSSYRSSFEVVRTEAGIHAGKCGLDFLTFASSLNGSGALFGILMHGFQTATTVPAECQLAQDVIESHFGATAALRTAELGTTRGNDINFRMAILGLVKIGVQLRSKADTNQDGSVDGGWDACPGGAAPAATSLTDAEVVQVGTGFALLMDNFATISASLGGNAQTISDMNTTCAALTPNPCTVVSTSDPVWSDTHVLRAFRGLVNSSSIGIQSCTTGLANPFQCCFMVP